MNGSNGSFETKKGVSMLCPICLGKLQMNIKFDNCDRFSKLIEVCRSVGFDAKAEAYQKLLE